MDLRDVDRCPCLGGEAYGECCGRFHAALRDGSRREGAWPATAEALMRSRYSAFAVGDVEYLLASWHPSTRPAELELDAELQWRRLDIVGTAAGGPFDAEGVVEFAAHYRGPGGRGVQRERSRFRREDGRWLYLDGDAED
ncbi:YchJ family protein [Zafaria sp. Z1313]|uniref:YchJ family protein n=1 Tax=Zafaria sp. Z1313 TaxID=3423202 RepID=UPI003D303A6B